MVLATLDLTCFDAVVCTQNRKDYRPLMGMGEKPSPLDEDFNLTTVIRERRKMPIGRMLVTTHGMGRNRIDRENTPSLPRLRSALYRPGMHGNPDWTTDQSQG